MEIDRRAFIASLGGAAAVAMWLPPAAPKPPKPRFLGPASVQIVDELTQETRVSVGVIGPVELVGVIGPVE